MRRSLCGLCLKILKLNRVGDRIDPCGRPLLNINLLSEGVPCTVSCLPVSSKWSMILIEYAARYVRTVLFGGSVESDLLEGAASRKAKFPV